MPGSPAPALPAGAPRAPPAPGRGRARPRAAAALPPRRFAAGDTPALSNFHRSPPRRPPALPSPPHTGARRVRPHRLAPRSLLTWPRAAAARPRCPGERRSPRAAPSARRPPALTDWTSPSCSSGGGTSSTRARESPPTPPRLRRRAPTAAGRRGASRHRACAARTATRGTPGPPPPLRVRGDGTLGRRSPLCARASPRVRRGVGAECVRSAGAGGARRPDLGSPRLSSPRARGKWRRVEPQGPPGCGHRAQRAFLTRAAMVNPARNAVTRAFPKRNKRHPGCSPGSASREMPSPSCM
ncbi:uncharacterized protein ACIQIH_007804 [Cyanocitta cristata]